MITIESKDITIKQIHDLFDYMDLIGIEFTLHIKCKDKKEVKP